MELNSVKYHTTLANYFATQPLFFDGDLQNKPHVRKCMEQPWQQTKAEIWDDVTETLGNLDFIQAKSVAKQTYDLVFDFHAVLNVIPDNQEAIQKEKARLVRIDKYTNDLIACAKGEITTEELEIPESITPWTKEQSDAETERIKTNQTKADRLKEFLYFLGNESSNLQNYASELAYFSHQQAWNYVNDGPVGKAAEKLEPAAGKTLLRRLPPTRLPWNPMPQALQTLRGHTSGVSAVAITADGKRAISGSLDKTCILWDMQSGEVLARFLTNSGIYSVSLSPNGLFLGSSSGEVIFLSADRELLKPGVSITTIRQIWDFELNRYLELSADCPLCGHRFAPPASVLATIKKISKKAGLRPEQSPCLELADEAWEEPGLLGECPNCGEKLKFNPFVAGGDDDGLPLSPSKRMKYYKRNLRKGLLYFMIFIIIIILINLIF